MDAIKLFARFDDPALGRLSAYFSRLFIHIDGESIQMCRLDAERNTVVSLEVYEIKPATEGPEKLAERVRSFFSEKEETFRNIPSVVVSVSSPFHTLVPIAFSHEQQPESYLRFNFELPGEMTIISDPVPEFGSDNIFALPQPVFETVKSIFPGAGIVHPSTAILRAFAYSHRQTGAADGFFLHTSGQMADMAVFDGAGLRFFNTLPVKGREDLLYFMLYIMEQEKLQPEHTLVHFSGAMASEPETVSLLEDYTAGVSMQLETGALQFSPVFNPATISAYRHLFSLSLCGS